MAKAVKIRSVYEDPPRNHVFLLTCMDQRLLDDTVHFMNDLNLHNRYDQLCLAGAAMGARCLPAPTPDTPTLGWKSVFFAHLDAAIDVLHRDIKDVFLLEHLDCGAYKYLHPKPKVQKQYKKATDLSDVVKFHREEAHKFAAEVEAHCRAKAEAGNEAWEKIRVRSLIIDLIGNVEDL